MKLPGLGHLIKPDAARETQQQLAVLDVGSNSVRMVQYLLEGRSLLPIFNEKVMAGLGKGSRDTGRLNPEGVEVALRTLKRFRRLMDSRGITEFYAIATAAVRDCEDGPAFVDRVRDACGIEIKVITGQEEGRLSALGLMAGIGHVSGLAADLGGSSLELTSVDGISIDEGVSLPLGPLNSYDPDKPDLKASKDRVTEILNPIADEMKELGETLYLAGGLWRAFASLAMELDQYSLHIVHQYELSRSQVYKTADFAIQSTPNTLAGTPGVSSKRIPMLPYAGMLIKRLMKLGDFKTVVFSANGLREGAVFDARPGLIEQGDPLVHGARALVGDQTPDPKFGVALSAWISFLFDNQPSIFGQGRDSVLRDAAARLTDIGVRMHPDHRSDLAATQVLYAPFGGITHPERAFLALAIHHRYAGKKERDVSCPSRRLIDDETELAALQLGLALRLGAALSGKSAELLNAFRLERTETELRLYVVEDGVDEIPVEKAETRLEQLASVFDLKPVIF